MTEEGKCCAVTGIGKFVDPLTIAPQSRDDFIGGRLLCNRVMTLCADNCFAVEV